MKMLHYGNFSSNLLVVDKTGCGILESHNLNSDSIQGHCSLEDVKILSRLGRSFYLKKEKDGTPLYFTIPSDYVLSWSVENQEN